MNTFYLFSILATAAIFTMLALSLNIITGYAGQAMMGIAAGAQFCENILYTHGNIGDLYSSGTIFWMNLTVGIKVMTGIGSITLLMLGIVNQKN